MARDTENSSVCWKGSREAEKAHRYHLVRKTSQGDILIIECVLRGYCATAIPQQQPTDWKGM